MKTIFPNGTTITMSVDELTGMLLNVARRAVEIERREMITRKEAIDILGSRTVLEKYIARGVIHPVTAGGNCKWRVLVAEVMAARKMHRQDDVE